MFTDEAGWTEFPFIETERLKLRALRLSDAKEVFIFRSDPIVQRYNANPMTKISEAEDLVRELIEDFERTDGVSWGITTIESNKVFGMIGLHQWSVHNHAILGYDLSRDHWGMGYGSEAARSVIQFGFDVMELNRIEAPTIVDNKESVNMLEKLGFTLEGIRREYSLESDGKYHDSGMYALLRSEFQASK